MWCFELRTEREGFMEITDKVRDAVRESGVEQGICLVFCPHTSAAITINENADPDVRRDLRFALRETFPDRSEFRHREGNSAAHLKSSLLGCSELIPIDQGKLALGVWQGVYFCEFDGPRDRRFYVQVLGE
ncbi:MAG: secondary thiamine-phosphate synthase enzyme YjbQ [Actinomycetota bacterium]|nr:secondary thiamine-phosphate synthase enzyme YjbQ [Actinomycetota bacterium]